MRNCSKYYIKNNLQTAKVQTAVTKCISGRKCYIKSCFFLSLNVNCVVALKCFSKSRAFMRNTLKHYCIRDFDTLGKRVHWARI